MQHPSKEVEHALVVLNDALCTWERGTNRQSVLILKEQEGYVHRSVNGKPFISDITDSALFNVLEVLHD